jgi:putative inorganic carbon (HCO3(-)) transporter
VTVLAVLGPRPAVTWRGHEGCVRLLVLYAFLLPVQLATPLGVRLAPSDALVLAYLALRAPHLRRVPAAWTRWHLALLLVLWSSVLVALARTGSISGTVFVTKALGMLVLFATFAAVIDAATDWATLRRVLRAFLVGALLHGGVAVLAFALRRSLDLRVPFVNAPYETSRATGLLIDPNAFGGLLAAALLLHLCTAAHGRPLLAPPWTRLADVVLPLALLATFSRSAWIGTVFGIFVVFVVDPSFGLRVLRRLLWPVAAATALGSIALPEFGALVSRPQQVQDRVNIADSALGEFLGAPLLGTGLGAYSDEHGVIVHNTLLWFLTEMGVVGLTVFLGLLLSCATRGWWAVGAAPRGESGLVLALLATVGVGVGLSVGIEALYQRSWWLALAGCGAAYALCREGRPAPTAAAVPGVVG